MRTPGWKVLAAVVALALAALPTAARKKSKGKPLERYVANVVIASSVGPDKVERLEIEITRWTTVEERLDLAQAFRQGGSKALARALKKQAPAGFIQFVRAPVATLRFARAFDHGRQRIIVVATDRPIELGGEDETDAPLPRGVTLAELLVDAGGSGDGTLAIGVEVGTDAEGDSLIAQSYSSEPLTMQSVRKRE